MKHRWGNQTSYYRIHPAAALTSRKIETLRLRMALILCAGVACCSRGGFEWMENPDAEFTSETDPVCSPAWRCAKWSLDPPIPVTELNSGGYETDPVLSPDCLSIAFGSDRAGSRSSDIWEAKRASTAQAFAAPYNTTSFNSADTEQRLFFSADGLQALVQTDRPGGAGQTDIWMATRPNPQAPFSALAPILELNSPSYEVNFVLSNDGLRITFARILPPAGVIMTATRPSPLAAFSAPTAIAELDSTYQEDSPTVSADETLIIFSSSRPGGPGSQDLFYAMRKSKNDPFGTPAVLPVVNTADLELNPFLACGDEELWFVSARGGSWDIYRTRFVALP